jgi:hypothetical protein
MNKTVGLWIDHKRAVIVFVAGKDTEIKLVSSDIEKHHRQSGVAMPADDVRQRELTGHTSTVSTTRWFHAFVRRNLS